MDGLDDVRRRALFLADGLRDYLWVLTTHPPAEFLAQARLVVGDKASRLLDAIDQVVGDLG